MLLALRNLKLPKYDITWCDLLGTVAQSFNVATLVTWVAPSSNVPCIDFVGTIERFWALEKNALFWPAPRLCVMCWRKRTDGLGRHRPSNNLGAAETLAGHPAPTSTGALEKQVRVALYLLVPHIAVWKIYTSSIWHTWRGYILKKEELCANKPFPLPSPPRLD